MTLPLTSPFTDGTVVNKAQLDQVVGSVNAGAFGFEGSNVGGSSTTLTTAATQFASSAVLTFVVPTGGRRYRIYAAANFAMLTGTNGRFTVTSGYNSGSSAVIGSFNAVSQARPVVITITGATNSVGQDAEGDVFLAAGTYTAYASFNRTTGGGATDVAGSQYIAVTDIGPV